MARIGKIRFVNFTYNDNRHIYDQTLDFYNGEDALLNLQNGGGKTVLVQMMMQPVIPNQKLKDRLFKDYFEKSKAPAYIMIEWILDGSGKRVLTGIGVKKVQGTGLEEEGNNIKIVTFLSEYEGGSNYDIRNIALTTEEKGIVKLVDFEKVVKNLSEAEKEGNPVWLFRWNVAGYKREYAKRLAEYQIHPSEWKNLMVKINEEEAGLTSFFNDCKTNKALIKKWFVPTIEDQLNQNGNLVENIRELIKNHTGQLVKNEDMIAERAVFEDFRRKSADVVADLEAYGALLATWEDKKDSLGDAYGFARESLGRLAAEKERIASDAKRMEGAIKELDYQRLSSEYYAVEGKLLGVERRIAALSEEMAGVDAEKGRVERKKNIALCSKYMEELRGLNSRIAQFEVELEKENLQQADRNAMIQGVRHALKLKYQEEVLRLEKMGGETQTHLSEEEEGLAGLLADKEEARREDAALREQWMHMRGKIGAFEESEKTLAAAYPGIPMNPASCREELEAEEAEVTQNLQSLGERRAATEDGLRKLEKECGELRDGYPKALVEKERTESAFQSFVKEKQAVAKVLKAHQLDEGWLFHTEKLLASLAAERERYQKLIHDRSLENAVLRDRLLKYQSGKALELPEEVKQAFEERNIFVEFGHEWLRNQSEHKKDKLRLVRNNPFLPYSLIVSRKDFELIQNTDFGDVIAPVIPILEREKLDMAFSEKVKNQVYAVDGMSFLVPFDDKVLNKNYVKELCETIQATLSENGQVISHAQEALNHISSDMVKIEGFAYTQKDEEELEGERKAVSERLQTMESQLAEYEEQMAALKQVDAEDAAKQNDWRHRKDVFDRKKEDVARWMGKYDQNQDDLRKEKELEGKLERVAAALASLERDVSSRKEDIDEWRQKQNQIATLLEKARSQREKYDDAEEVAAGNEDLLRCHIEQLESKLAAYRSESGGKIQTLRDVLEDYRRQRGEKQAAIDGFGLEEEWYVGKEYHAFEYDAHVEEFERVVERMNGLAAEKAKEQLVEAETKSDLKYMLKNMEEHCGQSEPLPKESIYPRDYEKEKEAKRAEWKRLDKRLSRCRAQENSLNHMKFTLEEYREFAKPVADAAALEAKVRAAMEEGGCEDFGDWVVGMVKQYKSLASAIQASKNKLAARYTDVENEFTPQSEMFKSLFHVILSEGKRFQPVHALNAFQRVFLQMDRKQEQHAIDMKKMDDMEKCIVDNTLSYLKNVYDEMNHIDRNSTIELDGKRCKMLVIHLPDKESLETISLKEYLQSTILNCVDLYKEGKPIDKLLSSEIDTYNLFDRLVGVNRIEIHLMKIEPNRLKKKTWRQVIAENSGGELFVSAFVVFISLLTYMRGDNLMHANRESKVLIMDNPFGPITSEHLLKPLFEISKKYHTQMICLTDVKGYAIYDRFDLIYSLNVEREVGREDEYIEVKILKKDVAEEEDEVLSASMFKLEDASRFELVN